MNVTGTLLLAPAGCNDAVTIICQKTQTTPGCFSKQALYFWLDPTFAAPQKQETKSVMKILKNINRKQVQYIFFGINQYPILSWPQKRGVVGQTV